MPFSRDLYKTGDGPEIITDLRMPPFGVVEALVDKTEHGPDLFRFWLLSHADENCIAGPQCLPKPEAELRFEALGPPLRTYPRTALVRVTLDTELLR